MISRKQKQRFALVVGIGATMYCWDVLTNGQVQRSMREARRAVGERILLIQDELGMQREDIFRKVETFTIQLPALPRPTVDEVRKHFSWVTDHDAIEIERDTSIIEGAALKLGTVLAEDEESIWGVEYERRLGTRPYFGLQHALWIIDHQDDPELKALKNFRGNYIDFPGIVLVDAIDNQFSPSLRFDGERRLHLGYGGINSGLDLIGRVARPCK